MDDLTIRHGFDEVHRADVARLFWQAFSAKLGRIMAPKRKALAFIETALDPNFAYSALDDAGNLLGVAGYKTSEGALVGGGLSDLARLYGWFGATWRGLVLGLLERDLEPGILLMDGIFVDAAARGRGVGAALLSQIARHAEAHGMQSVRLDVIDSNPRARALYERQGFQPGKTEHLGPFRHIFGFKSATRMVLTLPASGRDTGI